MKHLALLLILGFGSLLVMGQDENSDDISTIFSKDRKNGGYGALSFSYSEIDGKDAFIMGARGAWIIDHSFAIGLGGYGFINDINYDNLLDNDINYNLAGGYGGLFLEPILAPRFPVHISVPVLFGIGGVAYIQDYNDWHQWNYTDADSDVFLVFEPAVELEFNMTKNLRMAASLSYRFTSNIEMVNTNPEVLEGYNVGLVFKFGKY